MELPINNNFIPSDKKTATPFIINGFSKLSKLDKINYLQNSYPDSGSEIKEKLASFWHQDSNVQRVFDEFSENTISNFFLPFGVVPNFKINEKLYCIPMAIEESSVVAAASKSAKFWLNHGGFKSEIIATSKLGQVHFTWDITSSNNAFLIFNKYKQDLLAYVAPLCINMQKRGGGLKDIELIDKTDLENNYFQIKATFETCDAMGANFINTVLESLAVKWRDCIAVDPLSKHSDYQLIMCILSNYTPDCIVKSWVECDIDEFASISGEHSATEFTDKFKMAVRIAQIDISRATTHNKGIFNGIDAVVLATGNDFRAVEACGHTYASRSGQYRGLGHCEIKDGRFKYTLEIPLSLGTVGGLTSLHPLAKYSLDLLGNPSASDLMMIVASSGLAQNFGALHSLVTSGIQKGHMKMHLMNILNSFKANKQERHLAIEYFKDNIVSFNAVSDYLQSIRNIQ